MNHLIKDFFSWSKKERVGVIVLSVLLLSLFLANFYFDRWFTPKLDEWNADSLKYYSLILDSLEKDLENQQSFVYKNETSRKKKILVKQSVKFYSFDPNKINMETWMSFGFSEKQAQTILKFKKSIEGFKSIEDLSRCFVIDSIKLHAMTPYIKIDTSLLFRKNPEKPTLKSSDSLVFTSKIDRLAIIEINAADSIQLLDIRGIGPYFAGKILSYRKKLGGYKHKEQLVEIWNFDTSRFEQVKNQIIIDTNLIIKININRADVDEFKTHPYIRWGLANAIVKYKVQHGDYNTLEDLKNVVLMTDSIFNKLSPYLVIE